MGLRQMVSTPSFTHLRELWGQLSPEEVQERLSLAGECSIGSWCSGWEAAEALHLTTYTYPSNELDVAGLCNTVLLCCPGWMGCNRNTVPCHDFEHIVNHSRVAAVAVLLLHPSQMR
jgi:hypothetical protein